MVQVPGGGGVPGGVAGGVWLFTVATAIKLKVTTAVGIDAVAAIRCHAAEVLLVTLCPFCFLPRVGHAPRTCILSFVPRLRSNNVRFPRAIWLELPAMIARPRSHAGRGGELPWPAFGCF